MEGVHSCDFNYMRRELAKASFTLEDNPLLSGFLLGRSGRIADQKKNHYAAQHSETLIAHKSIDFVCVGGGSRSGRRATSTTAAFKLPRTPELEAIGYVPSDKHPNAGTFLAAAVADHVIQRFSEPGDEILTTAADKDDITALVLGQGRTFTAFVSDPAKESVVAGQVKAGCSLALVAGWFPKTNQAPKMVGQGVLPRVRMFRKRYHGRLWRTLRRAWTYDDGCDSEEGDDLAAHRSVAVKFAGMLGIEIKVSPIHGVGIFASKDLSMLDFVGIPLMGNFEVYDDVTADVRVSMAADGIPRYPVVEGELFQKVLQSYEVSREGAKLFLQPDPACVLYYMNSSYPDDTRANLSKESVFNGKGNAKELLLCADEGVVFKLARDVKEGEELLYPYTIFSESDGEENGAEENET